jgi:hypothetical protein
MFPISLQAIIMNRRSQELKVSDLCCRIWLVSTSTCLGFLERPHFSAGGVLSLHLLIHLKFHGDNHPHAMPHARGWCVLCEVPLISPSLAALSISSFSLFVALILLHNSVVLTVACSKSTKLCAVWHSL